MSQFILPITYYTIHKIQYDFGIYFDQSEIGASGTPAGPPNLQTAGVAATFTATAVPSTTADSPPHNLYCYRFSPIPQLLQLQLTPPPLLTTTDAPTHTPPPGADAAFPGILADQYLGKYIK